MCRKLMAIGRNELVARLILGCLVTLASLGWMGCRGDLSPNSGPPATFSGQYPIKVVCTTGPVTDMLRNIGGEHLAVTGLMGPGVDPHLYKVVPSDRRQLTAADLVVYNGLHLEGRMTEVFKELSRRKRTVSVTHEMEVNRDSRLRKPPEFDGYYDPHVWHAPLLWADCVKYIIQVLGEFDPIHREDYERNGQEYLEEVRAADEYCRTQLASIPPEQRALVTAHDAFNYFCEAYGLTAMPLKGISTDVEVAIGRMDEVVRFLVERKIKAVFVESAVAPRIVENLIPECRRKGHDVRVGRSDNDLYVLYADALGPPESGADTYLGMIRANVDTIVSALK
jgi:manganese/zinc/iron transport system substrate-binding protein